MMFNDCLHHMFSGGSLNEELTWETCEMTMKRARTAQKPQTTSDTGSRDWQASLNTTSDGEDMWHGGHVTGKRIDGETAT